MQDFAQKPITRRGLLGGVGAVGAVAAIGTVETFANPTTAAAVVDNAFSGIYYPEYKANLLTLQTRILTSSDVGHFIDLTIWASDSTISDTYTVYMVGSSWTKISVRQEDKKNNRVQVKVRITSSMVGKFVALQLWNYFASPKTSTYLMSTVIIGSVRGDYQTTIYLSDPSATIPTIASSAGFTTLAFADDFANISTIDTTLSGKAGFKWYPQMPWNGQDTATDEYSVSNSVLSINPRHRNFNYNLATANPDNSVGQTFGHGYYEACMRWNYHDVPQVTKNTDDNGFSWPAFWSLSLPYLTKGTKPYRELDFMESGDLGSDGGTVWDWQNTDDASHRYRNANSAEIVWNGSTTPIWTLPNGVSTSDWHIYGCLWQPGVIQWTFDGQVIRTFTWNGTTTSGAVDGNGNKPAPGQRLFTQFDDPTADMTVVLGTGTGRPFDVDWVHIWTK